MVSELRIPLVAQSRAKFELESGRANFQTVGGHWILVENQLYMIMGLMYVERFALSSLDSYKKGCAFSIEAMLNRQARSTVSGRVVLVSMVIISAAGPQSYADDATGVTNSKIPSPTSPDLPKSKDLRPQFKTWNLLPKSQRSRGRKTTR
jgi:hypothetical protein